MQKVKNNLRFYRKQKGLTQKQVADLLGFKSTDRISKWEKGTMFPHLLNGIKLAKLYETSVESMYEKPDIMEQY